MAENSDCGSQGIVLLVCDSSFRDKNLTQSLCRKGLNLIFYLGKSRCEFKLQILTA